MIHRPGHAEVWQETVTIPTYGTGKPDRNPMFLEKRVYQGSSGRVYPLPVVDRILDEKEDRDYTAVFLENDYLQVMVLPELGGRIQRALDKTNGYDFVYYNEVIKPALVGLTGPWISGGIEFNWPQHHRPTSFAPVDFRLRENADGSASVELSETDRMYGTKGMMTFTLYPDRAYIEVKGQLYNPTPLPQTFLWWANPAVSVNDATQSVFPPDVHAVYDHGKRDVSSFPIARGVYYKHDYSAGVDISRYRNIPVPTSYMCAHSDYDFVGNYDAGAKAGLLHVADHHVSPGKKQWTWGCGDFGRAWDRNLTDENGPYIELMTGMYCDNQPDFSWLKPYEEKTFTQYFMPYKEIGCVKNASRECALNLEKDGDRADFSVYATGRFPGARVVLKAGEEDLYDGTADLSPVSVFRGSVNTDVPETELTLSVYTAQGRRLLQYAPQPAQDEEIPDPMTPARLPEEIGTNEELYLTGLHLEQYRHATYLPDPYYLEALRRDPGDIRANTAMGALLLRRGAFAEAEPYFRAAIARMTDRNPNPYESEAFLDLGIALRFMGREDEAYDAFFKAVWTADGQAAGYYHIACIDCMRGEYDRALEHVERGLVRNWHNLKARALKGMILARLGREEEAHAWFEEDLKVDAFDFVSRIGAGDREGALRLMGTRSESYTDCALQYMEAGFYDEASAILDACPAKTPMTFYHAALAAARGGDDARADEMLKAAAAADPLYCFPNRLEDIAALEHAVRTDPEDARAPYYLGCLWYDRRRYDDAVRCWELSAQKDGSFPTVWRNLSLAYFNQRHDPERARTAMEKAYALDETDARVLLELDSLYRRLGLSPEERLAFLDLHRDTALFRDDLCAEYCTLLNETGRYGRALEILTSRRFHPWEGGEGKVTGQYTAALTQLGRQALRCGEPERAADLLARALAFPEDLGEGRLEGSKDNAVHYFLGLALRRLGRQGEALRQFALACEGDDEPSSAVYYNDQPADRILYQGLAFRALGREDDAQARFLKLKDWGEAHREDTVSADYFAVSLPDLVLFDEDLTRRNRAHCDYLVGLGLTGLGRFEEAGKAYASALSVDSSHEGAILHAGMLDARDPAALV